MTTLSDRKRRSAVFHPRPRKSASRRTAAKASVHRTEKRTKEMIWIVAPGRDATSVVMAKSSRWFRRRVRPHRPTLHSAQVLATRFVIAKWARDGVLPGKQAHERGCPQAAALQRGPGNGGCQVGSERKIESAVRRPAGGQHPEYRQ